MFRAMAALGLITILSIMSVDDLDAAESKARHEAGPLIGFSFGAFDIIQREDEAAEARVELRMNNDWWFKPMLNLTATTDRSAFVSAGIYSEIFLTDSFYLSPSFTPGAYLRGSGKDLGHVLEFRSQIELGWRFHTGLRMSISLNHISNAGLGRFNPGSESVVFSMLLPIEKVFDW